jgi:hypothetical protein
LAAVAVVALGLAANEPPYSVFALKQIGYVMLFPSPPSYLPTKRRSVSKKQEDKKRPDFERPYISAIFIGILALVAAFSIPYFSAFK